MGKPHNQDIPSIFTGFYKAKIKSLHKRMKKKPLIASKSKKDALFKARKQISETTTA